MRKSIVIILLCCLCVPCFTLAQGQVVNDVSALNPIVVRGVVRPTTIVQIADAVRANPGPISIGGAKHSMGGQTATDSALQIDMTACDQVLRLDTVSREVTVQAGITWRKLQEVIDPAGLSVMIMQTYADFTVGGSLSVNCHGRYVGLGPIILSVKSVRVVLADGSVVTASRSENSDLFYGTIGGYGGLGVIAEATLQLVENTLVERDVEKMPIAAYQAYFQRKVRPDSLAVFHNADIYPNAYRRVCAVTYRHTGKKPIDNERLRGQKERYFFRQIAYKVISDFPGGKALRQHVIDPILYRRPEVVWRNHEASYDANELEPASRKRSTYVLQEYFVPADSFAGFYPRVVAILRAHRVNALNISIRHARADTASLLSWARTDVFAFVLYYKQGTLPRQRARVGQWTRELIDAALACKGSYYLPYQVWATPAQFRQAYPRADEFFALKRQVDPTNKFRNRLWDTYYRP